MADASDILNSNNLALKRLIDSLPRIAASTANVLILGESGTGKELIARLIHKQSPRSKKKFVAVNCAAVPESLLESELFGHEKGAFTGAHSARKGLFQEADHGTIFLDEIGDMPLHLQAKLLRVLQEKAVTPVGSSTPRPVNFKLISATHHDLRSQTQNGQFRLDLFYRLNVIPLTIPPLRERREDIPGLISTFLRAHADRYNIRAPQFSAAALKELSSRRWEGNIRELENFIERLLITRGPVDEISLDDLAGEGELICNVPFALPSSFIPVDDLVDRYIMHVLKEVNYNQTAACQILGISRRTIYRKIRALADRAERPFTADL